MSRFLPTEVKAVAKLLDEHEAESAMDMAKAILLKLEELESERQLWILGIQHAPGWSNMVGPFPTPNQALKAAEKGVGGVTEGGQAGVWPLTHPSRWDDPDVAYKKLCDCGHQLWQHDFPKNPGCTINGCDCKKGSKQ